MKILHIFLFVICLGTSFAQEGSDQQLAQYYYSNGEFEKALPYCQKAFAKESNKFNFSRYYDCLIQTGAEKEAEKLLKKQISANESDLEYPVLLGEFYESHDRQKDADKLYQELIRDYTGSSFTLIELYKAFRSNGKYELALQTLEKGRKTLKDNYPLNMEFAELYHLTGQQEKMIDEYLDLIDLQSSYGAIIQTTLAQKIDFSEESTTEYELLKQKLLERSQKKPNDFIYAEMLSGFLPRKNSSLPRSCRLRRSTSGKKAMACVSTTWGSCVSRTAHTT